MYGKSERELANQILGTNTGDPYTLGDGEGFDMSNQDAKSHISEPPDLVDLSHIPDRGSPPDGAAAAPEPNFVIEDATADEQQKRQAAIDAE